MSGIAFDVLRSVDAISKEFKWDMGAGYCGKGQRMRRNVGIEIFQPQEIPALHRIGAIAHAIERLFATPKTTAVRPFKSSNMIKAPRGKRKE